MTDDFVPARFCGNTAFHVPHYWTAEEGTWKCSLEEITANVRPPGK